MSIAPRRIGKYELQKQLGQGSIGIVWKGYDLQSREHVAIKVLHADLQSDPSFMARFTSEGQNLTALRHPNIVQVREVNISRPSDANSTTAYIVADYVEGQSLADYIRNTSHIGNFPAISNIVALFNSLGVAIDHAHVKGLVHGHIKPGNILLNANNTLLSEIGEPILTDFGVAKMLGTAVGSQFTASTPTYISPEQARGHQPIDRSDIYSLGVILYELCTGVQPFQADSPVALMMHHINTLPTSPMLINTNIPPALAEVILRAMAKDPATRFPTASELAVAIDSACSPPTIEVVGGRLDKITRPLDPSSPFLLGGDQRNGNTYGMPTSILGVPVSHPPSVPTISSPYPAIPTGSQPGIRSTSTKPLSVPLQTPRTFPASSDRARGPDSTSKGSQSAQLPALIPAPPIGPPQPAIPTQGRGHKGIPPGYIVLAVILLMLILLSALGISLWLRPGSGSTGQADSHASVGHVFFQDDALGFNDMLRIDLQNIPAPGVGKSYYAWLQQNNQQYILLGPLTTAQNGSATLLYMGDGHYTNLLSIASSFLITLENSGNSPLVPSANRVYQASFDAGALPYIKNILATMTNRYGGSAAGLLETIKSINEKAGSIVDDLSGPHDYGLVTRQAIRIIELIDGTAYARSSGDLPSGHDDMIHIPVGLLSAPSIPGFLDTLATQVEKVRQNAGTNVELLQHAQNVSYALTDLQKWVQQMRIDDIHLLTAPQLSDPAILAVARDLKKVAADAYTGRTIPPNEGPLPILDSAGANQAYIESQYMAALAVRKVG